ncbi:EamA family transporter [Kocuria sp. p3-SID1433]|uniref:EamA family transporter n=1 Tax=unclassified Kocuria TaxID=2649579 RepID=UPI0021A4E95F|nr:MULTISPECIES: EamA family transporter [unclassified Kocuria]MCT1600810.1 EamA family transporter [Kocuria sp. p3-SID1428]MCT2180545.1 EamA family transporter [Kocuria sp. p3-SID1433]
MSAPSPSRSTGPGAAMVLSACLSIQVGAAAAIQLLFALAAALLSSVLPYSLEIAALRRLPSDVFSVLLSLEPAIAAVVGWVLLGQGAGVLSIAAVSLVVLASMGVTLGQGRPRADPEPSAA